MDTRYLIDAIVRQTTVLIAQLSTAAGIRAPLSHVADQVFVDLSRQIEAQGVTRKVAADMFGLALRTYQKRVGRLSESSTRRGITLWQAVLEFVENEPGVDRERVLVRFAKDGQANVVAVLGDLSASGILYCSGRGANSIYRSTSEADRSALAKRDADQALCHLAWLTIYRSGPLNAETLAEALGAPTAATEDAARVLIADGRVARDDKGLLSASTFLIPVGASEGWEAAVLDHFRAVSNAIGRKVVRGASSANDDEVGGGTLTFEVCEGHPHADEVRGLLARMRRDVNALWTRVEAHNQAHPIAPGSEQQVTFYYGQSCVDETARGPQQETETERQ